MKKRREDLTPEVRERIVKDYLAGVKSCLVLDDYKISPGELYRILHRAKARLRRQVDSSIRAAIKEHVAKEEILTLQQEYVRLGDILIKCLEAEPSKTIIALGYGQESFTAEQIFRAAFGILVEETLYHFPCFVCVGNDRWRVR